MKSRFLFLAAAVAVLAAGLEAQQCLECHKKTTPNIVTDWQLSKHSQNDVDCAACHGDKHKSETDVANAGIPTPDTCANCHEEKVAQFKKGKHAVAWAAVKAMPTAHAHRATAVRHVPRASDADVPGDLPRQPGLCPVVWLERNAPRPERDQDDGSRIKEEAIEKG
jgi:hypothetical protein